MSTVNDLVLKDDILYVLFAQANFDYILEFRIDSETVISYTIDNSGNSVNIYSLIYNHFTSQFVFGGESIYNHSDFLLTIPSSDLAKSLYTTLVTIPITVNGKIA